MYHKLKKCLNCRSSHQRCYIEKAVLKNFAIFTGKHLRWSLLLIVLQTQAWRPAIVSKETPTKRFSVNVVKILRTTKYSFKKICKQLLLLFLPLTINIFSQGLRSALNSISLFSSRSSLRFKEYSLVLVVDSSLIRKKKNQPKWSLIVTRCTTRCRSMYHSSVFL